MPPQYSARFDREVTRAANTIRRYRLQLGLTQGDVARVIGIRPATLSQWERGVSCPSVENLLRLAKALGTLAEALYPQFYLLPGSEARHVVAS